MMAAGALSSEMDAKMTILLRVCEQREAAAADRARVFFLVFFRLASCWSPDVRAATVAFYKIPSRDRK